MRVLVVGKGGREHALAWRLAQDDAVERVYCAPGNPGTAACARNVAWDTADGVALARSASEHGIDLVVIGPEAPLVAGLTDALTAAGLACCGPTAAAARLEGSKSFAKAFMNECRIPTARGGTFDSVDAALARVDELGGAAVIKADGLAAGKGVHVCADREAASAALTAVLEQRLHGTAGATVVVEELLDGEEASVFCLADGADYVLLPTSQDHKRLEEGDRGSMTGGMGAVSPAPVVTAEMLARVERDIIRPTLDGMVRRGTPYRGFLFVGLMIDGDGTPRVLEYNCRLGDPEAQVVLPRIEGPFAEVLLAAATGRLAGRGLGVASRCAACVVLASPGYPEAPRSGLPIRDDGGPDDASVFHAGTDYQNGALVTAGGRVLTVTALHARLGVAIELAYARAARIHWEGIVLRRDIGRRALERLKASTEVEQV